jgi:hypothetical protein
LPLPGDPSFLFSFGRSFLGFWFSYIHHFLATAWAFQVGLVLGFGMYTPAGWSRCRCITGSGLLVYRTNLGGGPCIQGPAAFALFGYGSQLHRYGGERSVFWLDCAGYPIKLTFSLLLFPFLRDCAHVFLQRRRRVSRVQGLHGPSQQQTPSDDI